MANFIRSLTRNTSTFFLGIVVATFFLERTVNLGASAIYDTVNAGVSLCTFVSFTNLHNLPYTLFVSFTETMEGHQKQI